MFIEFTLVALYDSLKSTHADLLSGTQVTAQDNKQVTGQSGREESILLFCAEPKTREEIQAFVGITHRE